MENDEKNRTYCLFILPSYIVFPMETKKRLSKVLAAAGVASRRKCEELIFEGKVTVNGGVALLPQTMVNLDCDEILLEGKKIQKEEKKFYFLLNKPLGYICTNVRVGTKKIVVDLFKKQYGRLFTVGRLDRDTTGLLLVTNDGHFANSVIHPSANLSKEYLVKTRQEISHDHLVVIGKGTMIEECFVRPICVTKVRKGTVKVTVKEGKKHEVRKLVEQAGLEIIELKRIRIGGLHLGTMQEGAFRALTETEKKTIFQ